MPLILTQNFTSCFIWVLCFKCDDILLAVSKALKNNEVLTTIIYEEEISDIDPHSDNTALFVESRKGKTILQYNGHRYRKAYKSRNGTRWTCSKSKNCTAFLYLNDEDEIIMAHQKHMHPRPVIFENVD